MHEESKEALEHEEKAESLDEIEAQDSVDEALGTTVVEAYDDEAAKQSTNSIQKSTTAQVIRDSQKNRIGRKHEIKRTANHPGILRRFSALFIDSFLVSVISTVAILVLTLLSSYFCYQYHYAFYGPIFPLSISVSLLSAFLPWLNVFNIGEVYKMALADPAHYGHMPEVLLPWTVVSLNIFLNLTYHALMTSSRTNATLGQKWLGMRVVTSNGGTVTLASAFIRSALKLAIWTYCSLFYWALVALQFTQVLDFILTIPAAWLLSIFSIACFDRLEVLHGAKYLLEQLWQKTSSTQTLLISSELATKTIQIRPNL